MEEILSTWLSKSNDRHFLLIIADRISGVHDEKGKHKPIAYQVIGSTLTIDFEESEQLTVSNVTDLITGANGELIIKDASEARFTWFSREKPDAPAKQCEEVFNKFGRFFEFSRAGAPFATSVGLGYGGDQFVVLRPV